MPTAEQLYICHCLLYEFFQGKSVKEAYESCCNINGKTSVSYATCEYWFSDFENHISNIGAKLYLEELQNASSNSHLQQLLNEDATQLIEQLAEALKINRKEVCKQLKEMGMLKRYGTWTPWRLSNDIRIQRYNVCMSLLTKQRKKDFLWNVVTGGERWIMYSIRYSNDETVVKENRKGLLWFWWDMKGMLYFDFFSQSVLANLRQMMKNYDAESVVYQINSVADEFEKKRPGQNIRKVALLYDCKLNAARAIETTIEDLGWEVLPCAMHSPDLAPVHYHIFPLIQANMKKICFQNEEEIERWIQDFMFAQQPSFFRKGIRKLPELWKKVMDNNGDYGDIF